MTIRKVLRLGLHYKPGLVLILKRVRPLIFVKDLSVPFTLTIRQVLLVRIHYQPGLVLTRNRVRLLIFVQV